MKHLPVSRIALACGIYFLLHCAADRAACAFQISPYVSIWYPPAGLALALLTLLGPRYFPVVLAARLATAFTVSAVPQWWLKVALAVLMTANYGGVAWLVRRLVGPAPRLRDFREARRLLVLTVLAPLAAVAAGTWLLQLGGLVDPGQTLRILVQWWLGDEGGILAVTPAVIVFVAPWLRGERLHFLHHRTSLREWLAIGAETTALLGFIVLLYGSAWLREHHAFFLCFLPLTWICMRHGLPGAVLATLGMTIASLIALQVVGVSSPMIVNCALFDLTAALVGLGLGSAVTRRAHAEAELMASEARLDRVIDGAHLGVWDREIPTGHVVFNQRWAAMLGYRLDEIEPHESSWKRLIHPDDHGRVTTALDAHLAGRTPFYEAEHRLRTKEGGWRWVLTRGSVVERTPDGRPLRVAGTHIDLTERKRAEAEGHRLLQIIEATTDFVATVDLEGRLIYANHALLRLFGGAEVSAVRGRPLADLLSDAATRTFFGEGIPAALKEGVWHGEATMHGRDRREFPVSLLLLVHRDDDGQPRFLSTIIRDVSLQKQAEAERMQSEREMLQGQKLESLGVLAGGIAHDFNNLLTAMLGNANLARLDLPPESPVHSSLQQIEKAALRAAELCKEMLAYSGRSQLTVTPVDLSALVEDTAQLLQVSISKKCVLKLELYRPLPPIKADSTQLRQIVMNLVLNASDAIAERSGLIRVCTGLMRAEKEYLAETFLAPDLPPGDYVYLEVNDNGCGMTPEVKTHLFEPFYTTKFAGHGLGLAAVLGIVRSHRGAIKVYSEPGRGTTFKLLFPVSEEVPGHQRLAGTPTDAWWSEGPALVIDDEESVRTVAARMLESFGFTVFTAPDGREGVRLFREHSATLRFVLLDLTMPHMDGIETFRELQRVNPEVPVILISGFTEKDTVDRFAGKRLAGFVQKPFERTTLQTLLEKVLAPV
jgi:PAS domain S-box-containing protein